MKKFGLILFFVYLLCIFSCKEESIEPPKVEQIQDVIQLDLSEFDEKTSNRSDFMFKSSYRSGNMVDYLFEEYLESNNELSQVIKNNTKFEETLYQEIESLKKYLWFSEQYYSDAKQQCDLIQDSVRNRIMKNLINTSEVNFSKLKYEEAINEADQLRREMWEEMAELKLILSEKLISRYQKQETNLKELISVNEGYKQSIQELKKIVKLAKE